MKKLIALVIAAAVLMPGLAFAGASTDAALGLGAFAVFNQILGGVGIFHRGPVVAAPPVVYAPPPPVYYAPPPRAYVPAPRMIVQAVSGVRAGAAPRGAAPAARVLPARPRPEGLVLQRTATAPGLALLIS